MSLKNTIRVGMGILVLSLTSAAMADEDCSMPFHKYKKQDSAAAISITFENDVPIHDAKLVSFVRGVPTEDGRGSSMDSRAMCEVFFNDQFEAEYKKSSNPSFHFEKKREIKLDPKSLKLLDGGDKPLSENDVPGDARTIVLSAVDDPSVKEIRCRQVHTFLGLKMAFGDNVKIKCPEFDKKNSAKAVLTPAVKAGQKSDAPETSKTGAKLKNAYDAPDTAGTPRKGRGKGSGGGTANSAESF